VWGWCDVQDEQHAIFQCTHPQTVSLRKRYESLFFEARAQDVSTFLHQNNDTLCFPYMNWLFFFRGGTKPKHAPFCMKGAASHTSLHQIGPNLASNWCWHYDELPEHVLRFRQVALRTEWQD
jgi:hypothetical protein